MSWSQPPIGVANQSLSPAFQAGHAGSIPVARSSLMAFLDFVFPCARDSSLLSGGSTVMPQDTGMAITLIGYRASPSGCHADGTVHSEELQAPMMRRARTRSVRRIAGGSSGTCPPDGPVIQTDRLCAAGTGQQGKDRGPAPPEPTGRDQCRHAKPGEVSRPGP
jgi:hypothetical protein